MSIFSKLGRSLVVSTLALTGSAIVVKKMPTKIEAAEPETKDALSKISRKNIEDEDGSIFLSRLSLMNRSPSQKWDLNWDK